MLDDGMSKLILKLEDLEGLGEGKISGIQFLEPFYYQYWPEHRLKSILNIDEIDLIRKRLDELGLNDGMNNAGWAVVWTDI